LDGEEEMSLSIVLPYTTSNACISLITQAPMQWANASENTHSLYGPFHLTSVLRPIRFSARLTVEPGS
jgi:hypothetical protein